MSIIPNPYNDSAQTEQYLLHHYVTLFSRMKKLKHKRLKNLKIISIVDNGAEVVPWVCPIPACESLPLHPCLSPHVRYKPRVLSPATHSELRGKQKRSRLSSSCLAPLTRTALQRALSMGGLSECWVFC